MTHSVLDSTIVSLFALSSWGFRCSDWRRPVIATPVGQQLVQHQAWPFQISTTVEGVEYLGTHVLFWPFSHHGRAYHTPIHPQATKK